MLVALRDEADLAAVESQLRVEHMLLTHARSSSHPYSGKIIRSFAQSNDDAVQ